MKKLLFGAFALGLLSACNTTTESTENLTDNVATSVASRKSCPSEEIRANLLANDADAKARYLALENGTEKFIQARKAGRVLADGTVEIPVVFNVLYRTSAENISDARLAEQIAVLNADYAGTNTDVSKTPSEFSTVAAGDTKVRFRLVKTVRKSTTVRSWKTNDAMKKASTKGIDATDPTQYFNIWVVGDMGSILGYATFPESAGQWNDGVVLASKYTGVTGATAPYNLGRTATHEVGHYLNLRHIWGDATCGNDLVSDTPTHNAENYGVPAYPHYSTCTGTPVEMTMNYMDYTDDRGMFMFMFTNGQKSRMTALFVSGGARASFGI